ncbi:MAG: hypothetical protein A2Z25_04040 [Planctomycetes bacterium RBG_16_55_9]|nr:MAG: hypothetical protein A2Z25_04040 [Planctomycetes bacterium RBG_16_55_9]
MFWLDMNMNVEIRSMIRALVVLYLGFSVGGCCRGLCKNGYDRAFEYRNGKVRVYRLVADLQSMAGSGRKEFLRGFEAAYREAKDTPHGEEYARILKEAAESGAYEQSFAQGQGHVNGQVADAQVQTMIRKSLGLSRGYALGWRAGYIEGFVREMSKKDELSDEESLYEQAETMYNALSPIRTSG